MKKNGLKHYYLIALFIAMGAFGIIFSTPVLALYDLSEDKSLNCSIYGLYLPNVPNGLIASRSELEKSKNNFDRYKEKIGDDKNCIEVEGGKSKSVDVIDDEAEFEYAMRSRAQTVDMLIDLRENKIRPRFPENFDEVGILRTELLSALMKFLPTTGEEFRGMIPFEIREVTQIEQSQEFLTEILEILANCDSKV